MSFDISFTKTFRFLPAGRDFLRVFSFNLFEFFFADFRVYEIIVVAVGGAMKGEVLSLPLICPVTAAEPDLIGDQPEKALLFFFISSSSSASSRFLSRTILIVSAGSSSRKIRSSPSGINPKRL